jgi:hypothetical protein
MAGMLITMTTGAGGLSAAVASAGLWLSVQVHHVPDPSSIALLVVGVMLLAIGFVANFECQSRRWADEMDAQLQVRRRDLQSLGIISSQSPRMR